MACSIVTVVSYHKYCRYYDRGRKTPRKRTWWDCSWANSVDPDGTALIVQILIWLLLTKHCRPWSVCSKDRNYRSDMTGLEQTQAAVRGCSVSINTVGIMIEVGNHCRPWPDCSWATTALDPDQIRGNTVDSDQSALERTL